MSGMLNARESVVAIGPMCHWIQMRQLLLVTDDPSGSKLIVQVHARVHMHLQASSIDVRDPSNGPSSKGRRGCEAPSFLPSPQRRPAKSVCWMSLSNTTS